MRLLSRLHSKCSISLSALLPPPGLFSSTWGGEEFVSLLGAVAEVRGGEAPRGRPAAFGSGFSRFSLLSGVGGSVTLRHCHSEAAVAPSTYPTSSTPPLSRHLVSGELQHRRICLVFLFVCLFFRDSSFQLISDLFSNLAVQVVSFTLVRLKVAGRFLFFSLHRGSEHKSRRQNEPKPHLSRSRRQRKAALSRVFLFCFFQTRGLLPAEPSGQN